MAQRTVLIALVAVVLSASAAWYLSRSTPASPAPAAAGPSTNPGAPATPASPSRPVPEARGSSGRPAAARPSRPAPRREPTPTPTPSTGTLHVDADVPGAEVFLDRRYLGKAPVTAHDVTPGTHRLNVSAPGWDGVAETIDVAPGSHDVSVKLKEVRLNASIAVDHKHTFGSGHGRLIATPAGLKFETDHAKDAFDVPFSALETFDVDYLAKTLTVKIRGGRTYVFTDPRGNPDHLFVFHRDVEQAREKLKKLAG
jgi:hypothetical protein